MTEIAVTGSTGRIGGRVARLLAADGIAQRLLVRDPARAPQLPGASVVQAEYGAQARPALEGVELAFMVSGSEARDRVAQHIAFVDAAAAAGVRRLVYLSFFHAAPDATFTLVRDHWATEQHIRSSGMGFTFVRDNLYADFLPSMAGADGVLRGPAGDGRVAAVAQDDVADVVAAVLRSAPEHDGAVHELTGPEAFTLAEAAAIITAATGRSVRYQDETVPEAYASRASYGAPDWEVEAWVTTYTAIAAGELDGVTDTVAALSGHPATSLAELLARSR